jgi:hypothetical protein
VTSTCGNGAAIGAAPFDEDEAAGEGIPASSRGFGENAGEAPASRLPDGSASCAPGVQSVPIGQFNALLYQHNVLREELGRVSDYLEGCDRLLGEMVKTISTLEERTRSLERSPASARAGLALSGALASITAGVQSALFSRRAPAMFKPTEVYQSAALR